MKYCFIINPRAGKGVFVEDLKASIHSVCGQANVEYDVFISDTSDATKAYVTEMANKSEDKIVFFACGGDGTLCKTILAVMSLDEETRKRACIGIVPKGTGNDFVSNFASKELFCDIEAQLAGTQYDIDLLKCNHLYSVNMINIGFDCHVVCKKEQIGKKKLVPRKLAYMISLLITFFKKPMVTLERADEDKPREKKELLLTTLANGSFCGGGFRSNPFASLTDGNIDCIEVKKISRTKFATIVAHYKKGTHLSGKYSDVIDHFKCKSTKMYFDVETPVSVDGEIIRTREIHISVAKRALTILLPRGVKPLVTEDDAE